MLLFVAFFTYLCYALFVFSFLLTPTTVAGVKLFAALMCVSVCLHVKTKTAETMSQRGPSTRLVETHALSTRPVLTGNGNRSPVNSGR